MQIADRQASTGHPQEMGHSERWTEAETGLYSPLLSSDKAARRLIWFFGGFADTHFLGVGELLFGLGGSSAAGGQVTCNLFAAVSEYSKKCRVVHLQFLFLFFFSLIKRNLFS